MVSSACAAPSRRRPGTSMPSLPRQKRCWPTLESLRRCKVVVATELRQTGGSRKEGTDSAGEEQALTIATTHVGSLPRGSALTPLLLARDHGETYDAALFDRVVQQAVNEAVAAQIAAGVTIVSDGELGKVGYSTYMI